MTSVIAAARRLALRLVNAVRPGRTESELARELTAHLALLEDEFRRRGLSPTDAHLAARRALGGVEQAKELHRDARSFAWIDDARRDGWQMLRSLNRHRSFAIVAILTLAIGIGANTALFSAFNAIVLRPLPYRAPDQLVIITPPVFALTSGRAFEALLQRANQVSSVAGFIGPGAATLLDHGSPTAVDSADVTWNFLSFLGTPPITGRDFTEADSRPGAPRVGLLTHEFWQRRFNGDRAIVGRTLTINNAPLTIVGVTSPTFRFPVSGLRPATGIAEDQQPGLLKVVSPSQFLNVIGRLKAGATPATAAADLLPIYRDTDLAQVRQALADSARVGVASLHETLAGSLRRWLLLVMATVALVLLVAAANVANLLLARASSRQRELAVRAAMGAPLGRLVRMTLTESLVLALIGAMLALLITWWAGAAARPLLADRMPHVAEIGIDWSVFAFNAALATVTGLVCGLASLSAVRRLDVVAAFNEGGTAAMSGRSGVRQALLSAEAGFTFVLVLGALLVAQTFRNLETKELGFDAHNVLTLRLSPGQGWRGAARDLSTASATLAAYLARTAEQVDTLPGVASTVFASAGPLAPFGPGFGGVAVQGLVPPADQNVNVLVVSPHYFGTMRTPIVEGRELADTDTATSGLVVVVNQALQRRFAAGRSLIDATLRVDGHDVTIVGVARDVPGNTLRDEIPPLMYMGVAQIGRLGVMSAQMSMMVRTTGVSPASLANDVRRRIWAVDGNAIVADVTTLDDRVGASLRTERQSAVVFTSLAVIALIIAAIGVYGVATCAMAQRTKELGIRIAMGATRRDIAAIVLRHAVLPALVGMAMGVPAAAASTRLLGSLLYGVTPLDASSFAAAGAVLAIAAVLATIAPTRRVWRLDPLRALKTE